MKKQIFLLLIAFLSWGAGLQAQIQFEKSFPHSGTFADLELDGQKFFVMDVASEQCRFYNLDYSLWKTVQFNVPDNQYLSDAKFLSQHLFNSDDLVEMAIVYYKYVETSTSYYYIYTTEIVNENGSVLLSVPGSSWVDVVRSALEGSRVLFYVYDYSVFPYTVQTQVYSIPGRLTGLEEPGSRVDEAENEALIFPNPIVGPATLKIQNGGLQQQARLLIRDEQGRLYSETLIRPGTVEQELNLAPLQPGTYIYEVISPFYRSKPSRFVKLK